ncbi:EF-hand [Rickenella mellea]|uniref:EF-hand n=1 Tax=Rickenella mellea TaxID=50990 RepID=A0A4Y7PY58_9AGAM|nr:EF-hand [Rickenella mellea]
MANQLSQDQIAEFKKGFSVYDKNGDGKITASELGAVMRSLGQAPSDNELQSIIRSLDANGDGTIELSEYLEMMAKKVKENTGEEDYRAAFSRFDVDGNGSINKSELRHVMETLGEGDLTDQEMDEMFREADANNDGIINVDGESWVLSSSRLEK